MSLTKLRSDIRLGTGKWLTLFYSVNSVVPHSSAAGVAVAWGGDQAPLDITYIVIFMLNPLVVGSMLSLLLLPGAETRLLCVVTYM